MTTTTSANPATPEGSSRLRRLRRTLYRGDPGMWSWVLHRITGATVFFFLFIHVLDTALVRISPQAYDEVISTYKTPIVGLMELGLVAAVLYHALNGIRVPTWCAKTWEDDRNLDQGGRQPHRLQRAGLSAAKRTSIPQVDGFRNDGHVCRRSLLMHFISR